MLSVSIFILLFSFFSFSFSTSLLCSGNGHLESSSCICRSQWTGTNCDQKNQNYNQSKLSQFNETNFQDWLEIRVRRRMTNLYNLDPNQLLHIDDFFPENATSINKSNIPNNWISLKTLASVSGMKPTFMRNPIQLSDIKQGGLKTCFFYAALGSLVNHANGSQFIKDAIPYYNESNSIYVTKWFLFGKYIYVSVNDVVPVDNINKMPYFAQLSKNGTFWVAILEKAWAKIWGNYANIGYTNVQMIWTALTGANEGNSEIIAELTARTFRYNFIDDKIEGGPSSNTNYYITSAQSKSAPPQLVPDHSYSILGWYASGYNYLVHIFNPWGIDPVNNTFADNNQTIWKTVLAKNPNIPFLNDSNDGTFFLNLTDFLANFVSIIQVYVNYDFKPMTWEIPLWNLSSSITFVFLKIVDSPYCSIYFDLSYRGVRNQIQPYSIQVDVNYYMEYGMYNTEENTYYGMYLFPTYNNTSLVVTRFNHDVIDKIYATIYAPNGTLNMAIQNIAPKNCEDQCNSHGTCQNNQCNCTSSYFGKACSLTKKMLQPNPTCQCSGHGICLSTGICQCEPGMNSSNNCSVCRDYHTDCQILLKGSPYFCQGGASDWCLFSCRIGECYIPGETTQCELPPGCNSKGVCCGGSSGFGQCRCVAGYNAQTQCATKI